MLVEKVPGEEGVRRAEQREDEVRPSGAWSLRGREEPQQGRSAHVVRGFPVSFEGQAHDCGCVPHCIAGQPRAVGCANNAGESTVVKGLIGVQLPIFGLHWKVFVPSWY